MSTDTPQMSALICPSDGTILGDYCEIEPDEYECPHCRRIFAESEVKA